MTRCFLLLAVISICCLGCNATSDCEMRVAELYLDTAVDMIQKARNKYPRCVTCDNILTERASDCSDLLQMGYNKSGVYTIWPANRVMEGKSLEVYCDMETDDGGWTLIQRRGNFHRASDYFFKDWKSYKEGFGDIDMDFWLGNDNIFALTNQKLNSVRFDLKDVDNNTRYAHYDTFWIDDEHYNYTLHITNYSGDAGDSMAQTHNNQKFSTKDYDNDSDDGRDCAQLYKGAWWYNKCHKSNLNGLYLRGKHKSFADGVNWETWKGDKESMESTEIKIRPKTFKMSPVSLSTPM